MCSKQAILFGIVDIEDDGSLWPVIGKIVYQLHQGHDSHAIVRCSWCGRDRVKMGGEQDAT